MGTFSALNSVHLLNPFLAPWDGDSLAAIEAAMGGVSALNSVDSVYCFEPSTLGWVLVGGHRGRDGHIQRIAIF